MKIVAIYTYVFELVLMFVLASSSLFAQCHDYISLENGSIQDNETYQSESEIAVSDFWFGAGSQTYLTAGEEINFYPGVEVEENAFLCAYPAWCNPYPNYKELAMRWAPVVYQDLRNKETNAYNYNIKEDMICKVNFDGDWNAWNNWENTHEYPLVAASYYSVQETATHYFIGYHFFHPRDAANWDVDKHENDLEGITLCVQKDGSEHGKLMALTTIKHSELKKYSDETEYIIFNSNIHWVVEKLLTNWEGRPEIFISSNGNFWTDFGDWGAHGHGIEIHDGSANPGDDGVVYHVAENGEVPDTEAILSSEDPWANTCPYELVSINELWYRRLAYSQNGPGLYSSFGEFGGDDYVTEDHHANAPWNWNNGGLGDGIGFSDPAHEFDMLFDNSQIGDEVSHQYIYNPYYTHKVDLLEMTMYHDDSDGIGGWAGDPDIYFELESDGASYMGDHMWKKNECNYGVTYPIYFGQASASLNNDAYEEQSNRLYLSRDVNQAIEIQFWDSDLVQKSETDSSNQVPYKAGDDFYGLISRQVKEGDSWGPDWEWNNTDQGKLKYAISAVPTEPIPEAPKFKETNAFNSIDWVLVEGAGRFDEVSNYEYSYDGGNSWNNCYAKPQPLPSPVDFSNVLLRTKERTWLCQNGSTEVPISAGYPLYYQQFVDKAENEDEGVEQTSSENEFQNSISLTQVGNGLELSIDFEKWSGGRCIVSDASGRLLESRQLDSSRRHRISSIGWPPGLLIVKIQTQQFSAAFKLLSS